MVEDITDRIGRRRFLSGTAVAALGAVAARTATAATDAGAGGGDFAYEVVRSEDEWRHMLDEATFKVMREGATEEAHSSPLAAETGAGSYSCKGCDLPLYDSRWKVPLDKGWAFFRQSVPNAMLMSTDELVAEGVEYSDEERKILDESAAIEVHCRRCGSHIGHILMVEEALLHCSNGSALTFGGKQA